MTKTKAHKFREYDSFYNTQGADKIDIQANLRIFKLGIMYNF